MILKSKRIIPIPIGKACMIEMGNIEILQRREILKLITGSKIYLGDTIVVSEQSKAQILLLDETALTIGEKSELEKEKEDFSNSSKNPQEVN